MTRNNVHEPDESDVRHVAMSQGATPELRFPIDVTFPGENEPDQVDAWISAYAEPFYIRA